MIKSLHRIRTVDTWKRLSLNLFLLTAGALP